LEISGGLPFARPELVEGCGVADDYCRPVVRQAQDERAPPATC